MSDPSDTDQSRLSGNSLSSQGFLERARQKASGDTIILPGHVPAVADTIQGLDHFFKNPDSPWTCSRCGCVFVPGEYRITYWHDDGQSDAEAVAYCATCQTGISRKRPLRAGALLTGNKVVTEGVINGVRVLSGMVPPPVPGPLRAAWIGWVKLTPLAPSSDQDLLACEVRCGNCRRLGAVVSLNSRAYIEIVHADGCAVGAQSYIDVAEIRQEVAR
jgi:hypothetical protein